MEMFVHWSCIGLLKAKRDGYFDPNGKRGIKKHAWIYIMEAHLTGRLGKMGAWLISGDGGANKNNVQRSLGAHSHRNH